MAQRYETENRKTAGESGYRIKSIEETPEAKRKRLAENRKKANKRLNRAMYPKGTMLDGDIRLNVLKMYGRDITPEKYTPSQIQTLCLAFVAHDLFVVEMLNEDGTPSDLSADQGEDIDPEDYRYVGVDYYTYRDFVGKAVYETKGSVTEDNGDIATMLYNSEWDELDTTDIVAEFNQLFKRSDGKIALLVVPGILEIDSDHIVMKYDDSFMPPFGGPNAIRTVFVPVDHLAPPTLVEEVEV